MPFLFPISFGQPGISLGPNNPPSSLRLRSDDLHNPHIMTQNGELNPGNEGHPQSTPAEAEQGISGYKDRVDSGFVQQAKNTDDTPDSSKTKEPIHKSPEPRKFYLGKSSSEDDERHSESESYTSTKSMNLEQLFHFGEFNLPRESLSLPDSTSGELPIRLPTTHILC